MQRTAKSKKSPQERLAEMVPLAIETLEKMIKESPEMLSPEELEDCKARIRAYRSTQSKDRR